MKTLVLLDSNAILHRAYHALPPFRSKKTGEPTGALYGFSTMLIRVIKELKPDCIAAAIDLPQPTFRDELYKEYKAKRPDVDADLILQLKRMPDLISAFGIKIFSAPGFEADDILGTIVEQTTAANSLSEQEKVKIVIVSGDADILQLVDKENVLVYTMRRGMEDTIIYNEKKVIERFGFEPELIPDFKGLKGDTSDNIIGVNGVGDKIATNIIKNFGTLENLYHKLESADEKLKAEKIIKERVIRLLLEHKKDALFSKMLATIRKDAPIKFEISALLTDRRITEFKINIEKLTQMFDEFGFDSLIKRLEWFITRSMF